MAVAGIFQKRRRQVLGMGLVVSLVLAAVFAPMLALYDGMQYL